MAALKIKEMHEGTKQLMEAERYEEIGDLKNAFNHLLLGSKLGDSSCQLNLGNYFASGTGTKKSFAKASYWYKKAYHHGNPCGARNLAIDKRNQGNLRSAVTWFKKAIAMSDGESYVELAKIYINKKDGHQAAAKLLKRALRLKIDNISEAAKEEAQTLMKQLSRTGRRPARKNRSRVAQRFPLAGA